MNNIIIRAISNIYKAVYRSCKWALSCLLTCISANLLMDTFNSIPRSLDAQLANTKLNIYTPSWLSQPDTSEYTVQPFPTNGDRFAAFELHKRLDKRQFKTSGFIGQAIAAGWHHKSPEKIREIGDKVGRERIQVIHGTADRMITFPHGETLARELGGEEGGLTMRFIQGQAHVIPAEMRSDFKVWVEEIVEKAEALNRDT